MATTLVPPGPDAPAPSVTAAGAEGGGSRFPAGQPPAGRRRRHRVRRRRSPTRRLLTGAAAVGAVLAVVAVHALLTGPLKVPIIHPDEFGYLQNARYLARGGRLPETEYYPGFSLLLVPLWWLSNVPLTVWRGALMINAGLSGVTAVLAWRVAGRLVPGLGNRWRAVLVAVAVAYPPIVLYSDFALSETAFAAGYLAVVALVAWATTGVEAGAGPTQTRPGAGARRAGPTRVAVRWALVGLATGLLALVHPRGFAVVVAVWLLGLAVLARRSWRGLAGLAVGTGLGVSITRAFVTTLKAPNSQFGAYNPSGIVSKSLSIHGALSLLSELGGQFFYLSVATVGLVPLGVWLGLRSMRAFIGGDRRPAVILRSFVTVSFLGVWAISSLFMNLGNRADYLVYGRYDDAVVIPLIVMALAHLLVPRAVHDGRSHLRPLALRRAAVREWLVVATVAVVGSGLALTIEHSHRELSAGLNTANVLGIAAYVSRSDNHIDVWALTGLVIAGVAVLAAVAVRWPALTAALLIGLWGWASIDTQNGYIAPGSRARASEDVVATTLAALKARTTVSLGCVAWDATAVDDFFYYATAFALPDQVLGRFDSRDPHYTPCGPVVVSPRRDLADRFPGALPITRDPDAGLTVWVLPGSASFDALNLAGWLLPYPQGGPLPSGLTASLIPGGVLPSVPAGGSAAFSVVARHPPGDSPWPSVGTFNQGIYAVRLAVRWYSSVPGAVGVPGTDDQVAAPLPVAATNVELPATVLPGQSVRIPLTLTARALDGKPLAPGSYVVSAGLYQEGVGAFTSPPLLLVVRVLP